MVSVVRDLETVKRTLAEGHLTVTDPRTGYHRFLHADCPEDGQSAAIWRIVREHGREITEVMMRCARCGREFAAPVEALYLR